MTSPAEQHRQPNRLIHENSPYLLQHAYNPVQWLPWGEEAFAAAAKQNRPIFLSIGYSACHWCHVMEEETFDNPDAAALLNRYFVPVKVDREERPDVDSIYMNAVQMMTGHGGWPLSVFLTPERTPFFGGTYFPWTDRHGLPGFKSILTRIAELWQKDSAKLRETAAELTQALQQTLASAAEAQSTEFAACVSDAIRSFARSFDTQEGGFGKAPKFPPAQGLAFLLRHYHSSGDQTILRMVEVTLDKMAAGGLFDQLGGGFHRYAVDAEWLVPHFEKMLYDNALLADVYTEAFLVTGRPLYRQTAMQTLDYLLRDMRDEDGGFHSAEDADSEGAEGLFYTWTAAEIRDVLPAAAAKLICLFYGISAEGNFEGRNILHRRQTLAEIAATKGADSAGLQRQLQDACRNLFEKRCQRVRPRKDDKVLTAWNALAISAFAKACQAYREPRYLTAAQEAMTFILTRLGGADDLQHMCRQGKSQGTAFLDDYALLANACLDLYETDLNLKWFEQAERLTNAMLQQFWDADDGGFYFTGEQQDLVARDKPFFDSPTPSGNAAAIKVLQRLGRYRPDAEQAEKVAQGMQMMAAAARRYPEGFAQGLINFQRHLAPPLEFAIGAAPDDPLTLAFLRLIHTSFLPFKALATVDSSPHTAQKAARFAFTQQRQAAEKPLLYICDNFRCSQPLADLEAATAELRRLAEPGGQGPPA